LNLQQRLSQAWFVQKKILEIHKKRNDFRRDFEEKQSLCQTLQDKVALLEESIATCKKKEFDLDAQVIRYAASLKRTKEQTNIGLLDLETGRAQCTAIEEKIDTLEEEYFVVVEQRETEEKERFVCIQKNKLHERARKEIKEKQTKSLPLLQREEEDLEEKREELLSRAPQEYVNHFEKLSFTHPNLVVRLRDSFCGSCLNKLPLRIVGELTTGTGTHICSTCKAFCIAP
jgi:predicted  nucleic acid-binding Zn-ribbon protein